MNFKLAALVCGQSVVIGIVVAVVFISIAEKLL